jgi:hypothetical protein
MYPETESTPKMEGNQDYHKASTNGKKLRTGKPIITSLEDLDEEWDTDQRDKDHSMWSLICLTCECWRPPDGQ